MGGGGENESSYFKRELLSSVRITNCTCQRLLDRVDNIDVTGYIASFIHIKSPRQKSPFFPRSQYNCSVQLHTYTSSYKRDQEAMNGTFTAV